MMLENLFTTILNMTLTASIVAVLIIAVRLAIRKKLPKVFSYALWAILLVRLLVPFSFSAGFSIFNVLPSPKPTPVAEGFQGIGSAKIIPDDIGLMTKPSVNSGNKGIDKFVSGSLPAATPYASINPMQVILFLFSAIWMIGAVILFMLSVFAYLRAVDRLKTAVLYEDGGLAEEAGSKLKMKRKVRIYTSDRIHTPVVCGLIKPRIILPLTLTQGDNRKALLHIYLHELVHIKRLDYIIKPLSVTAVCLHWFNPLVWLSFVLAQKDMEMSCDARVVTASEKDIRGEYATSLINLAASRQALFNCGLLAFGESNIRSRIKEIGSYKKPVMGLAVASVLILITVGMVLLTNAQSGVPDGKPATEIIGTTTTTEDKSSVNQGTTPAEPRIYNDIEPAVLIENLDKKTDEIIDYAYNQSPDNIAIANTYEGNYTDSGKTELLVIFKILHQPHAGGLDCSVAAVYDRNTLELISQKTFPYDECNFQVLSGEDGRSYLLFAGSSTYQGNTGYQFGLWKMAVKWELKFPENPENYVRNKGFAVKENGTVWVLQPYYPDFGANPSLEVKWLHRYNLVWNRKTLTMDKIVPGIYLDPSGKPNVDAVNKSPDGKYAVSTISDEFDGEYRVLIYDTGTNRLAADFELLAQYYGFLWSDNSSKVCVTRMARIWTELSIIDMKAGKVIDLPSISDLIKSFKEQGVKIDYTIAENRPDPQLNALDWSPDGKSLLVFYQWSDQSHKRRNGTFVFNVESGAVSEVTQNKPDGEDGYLKPEKPENFNW